MRAVDGPDGCFINSIDRYALTVVHQVKDEEYQQIMNDVREEAKQFGALNDVVIPRPDPDLMHKEGVGKVRYIHQSYSCVHAYKHEYTHTFTRPKKTYSHEGVRVVTVIT